MSLLPSGLLSFLSPAFPLLFTLARFSFNPRGLAFGRGPRLFACNGLLLLNVANVPPLVKK
jgi:hypothetical protein